MKVLAKSDKGKLREQNEDYYYVSDEDKIPGLYMLADGMGGYEGGEVASRLAIDAAARYIGNHFDLIEHMKEDILELIEDAMKYTNEIVFDVAKNSEDSRIYRIRGKIIRKLTTDHSYVEQLVKDGTITKEEAKTHPKKNMLMKALGCSEYVEPDVMVKNFQPEDIIVMTSDGLTNMVDDNKIFETVKNNFEASDEMLINMANDAGGIDNITVVIIKN